MLNGGSQSLPPVEGVGRIKAVGLQLLTPLPGPGAKPSRNLLYQRPPLRTLAIIPANPPMLYQPQFKSLCQTQELTRRRLFTSRVPFRSHPRHQRPLEPSGWATQFCFYSSLLWTCYYMHLDDYKATTKVLHMCFRSLAQFFNHSPAFYQGHKGQKEGSSPRWKKKEENDETNLLQCIIKKCNSAKKKTRKNEKQNWTMCCIVHHLLWMCIQLRQFFIFFVSFLLSYSQQSDTSFQEKFHHIGQGIFKTEEW